MLVLEFVGGARISDFPKALDTRKGHPGSSGLLF